MPFEPYEAGKAHELRDDTLKSVVNWCCEWNDGTLAVTDCLNELLLRAERKIEAMEKAGITVVRNLGELGKTAVEVFGK